MCTEWWLQCEKHLLNFLLNILNTFSLIRWRHSKSLTWSGKISYANHVLMFFIPHGYFLEDIFIWMGISIIIISQSKKSYVWINGTDIKTLPWIYIADLCCVIMTSSNGEHFLRYWIFVQGIHRPPVNSLDKSQWCGAFMFCLICAWINGWVNNREASDKKIISFE